MDKGRLSKEERRKEMSKRVEVCPVCFKVKAFGGWIKLDKEKLENIGKFGVVFEKCLICLNQDQFYAPN